MYVCMYGVRQCYGKRRRNLDLGCTGGLGNLRGLLVIRRMDKVLNLRIRELCGVKKGLDERIDEGVLKEC